MDRHNMDVWATLAPFSNLINDNANTSYHEVSSLLTMVKNTYGTTRVYSILVSTILPSFLLLGNKDKSIRDEAKSAWDGWGAQASEAYNSWQSGSEDASAFDNSELRSALKKLESHTKSICFRFEKLLNPNIQYTRSVDWPSVREFFTLVQSEPGSVPREFEDPMKDYAGTDATIVRLNEHLAKRKKQVEAQQEKLAEQQSSITSSMATYRTLQSANTTLSSQVQQLKAELEKANETIRLHDSHRINLEQVTESRDTWHSAYTQVASKLETKATQLNKKQIEVNDLQTDFESVQENIHRLETECTRTQAYDKSQAATVMLAPKPVGFALMPNAPKKKSESFRLLSKIFASRIARKTTMMTPQKGE